LDIRDLALLLRRRWIIICATVAIILAAVVATTLMTTPLYQASTRLVVEAYSGGSASDVYKSTLASEKRSLSYAKLITGEALAQRTIDKMHLTLSPDELRQKIKATASPDTVLIDVSVLDPSPTRARDIANTLSDEFVVMVRELETPAVSLRPDARVIIEKRASLPTSPVIPRTVRNVVLGLALGLLLGLGLAVLSHRLDGARNRRLRRSVK
jgi:capsular polysaccharide biosynthesis protein